MNLRTIFSMLAVLVLFVSACSSVDEANNQTGDTEVIFEFPILDKSGLSDNVVAMFDGGEITGEQFATFLAVQAFFDPHAPINESEYRQEVIQELIMEKTIYDKSDEDWAKDQAEIVWEQIEWVYGEETIQDGYDVLNITEDDIRLALISMFKIEAYFRDQITDEDLTNFYDEVTDELTTATFTHILISTEEIAVEEQITEQRSDEEALQRANELYEQLKTGGNINELASEYSDDRGSIATGGRYEDVAIVELVPEFTKAILQQEINQIGEPVKTDYGYHIIKVEDLQTIPFEEVKDAIISELVYEKYTDYYFNTLLDLITEINL